MDLLRAHAYLALLNGQSVDAPPASLLPPGLPASCRSRADGVPASRPYDDPAAAGGRTSRPGCAAAARAARPARAGCRRRPG